MQMTGSVSGDDGKYYILVKYERNKEKWWVHAEDVKELVPEGGRNKTTHLLFSGYYYLPDQVEQY